MRGWRTRLRVTLLATIALCACALPTPAMNVSLPASPASPSGTYSAAAIRMREALCTSTPTLGNIPTATLSLVSSPTPTQEPGPLPSFTRATIATSSLTPTHAPATATRPEPTPLATRTCIVERAHHYASTATRYQSGASGPTAFDCTGLVYRVFHDCSATDLIGAQGQQPVASYLRWFIAQARADQHAPMAGDLIVYGEDCSHVAIYIGAGQAISTLSDGVREHDATRLHTHAGGDLLPIQAYLHITAE